MTLRYPLRLLHLVPEWPLFVVRVLRLLLSEGSRRRIFWPMLKLEWDLRRRYQTPEWRPIPMVERGTKVALIASAGDLPATLVEVFFAVALGLCGWRLVVVSNRGAWINRLYRIVGVRGLLYWEDARALARNHGGTVSPEWAQQQGLDGIMSYTFRGARVGVHSISAVIRERRAGFDPDAPGIWEQVARQLTVAQSYACAADHVLELACPQAALFNERGYNKYGPLFDLCMARGIDCVQWVGSHRDGSLTLKRYSSATTNSSPLGLSDDTWRLAGEMPWDDQKAEFVYDELRECYSTGQWFGEVGTQFGKAIYAPDQVARILHLDPNKRTAVIFAHMFWDATFFYGRDLFRDYEDWFVETVRAAIANPRVNWLIKVHPANSVKNRREGVGGRRADMERVVIHEQVGSLPAHVQVLPEDSDVSTYSLFGLMDCCVTVRGTVGMEAACFGIPVVTAGTGRYDRRGFTIDPQSREAYRDRLAECDQIPTLSPSQKELALRFAYASLRLRPFRLGSIRLRYLHDRFATPDVGIMTDSLDKLLAGPDMRAFVEWFGDRSREDFIDRSMLARVTDTQALSN